MPFPSRTAAACARPGSAFSKQLKLKLSQDQFAKSFGLAKRTVQDWEQGRRHSEGAARVLLKVIEKEPKKVRRALEAV